MSLVIVPAATLVVSALTYKLVWIDLNSTFSLQHLVNVCLSNSAGWFKKDIVSSSFAPKLNDVVCLRLAFLKQIFHDRSGHGVFLIYGSILIPLILRLSYKAASPNTRSIGASLLLPALACLLTSSSVLLLGSGLGIFLPPLITLLYTAAASSFNKSTLSVPLPAVTRAVYGANLVTLLSSILFLFQFFTINSEEDDFSYVNHYLRKDVAEVVNVFGGLFADVFPLVISIPLLGLAYKQITRPKTTEEATVYLKEEYLASEVAYGFERTWAYYRQTGLLSTIAYMYGMSRVIRANILGQESLSSSSKYLLLVSFLLALTQASLIATDVITTQEDAVDDEARKAIAKAPAGNPGVDDNIKVLALLAIITGPSLPAMLWYARGEEFKGWKGRRAWRLATADQKAIK